MYHYVRYCGLVLLIWCLDWAADSLTMYSLVQCDSQCVRVYLELERWYKREFGGFCEEKSWVT